MNYFSHKKLKEFCIDTLVHEGIAEPIAEDVASCLIETSLRGVDSHGIRLLPHYIRVVRSGRINKNPNIKFNQNTFIYVISGAFEVNERLLETGETICFWDTHLIEFEALSKNAVFLMIEVSD